MEQTFQVKNEQWEWAKDNLPLESMTATEAKEAIEAHFGVTPNELVNWRRSAKRAGHHSGP